VSCQEVEKRREILGFARVIWKIATPASLGYPPSVFNKNEFLNSTFKRALRSLVVRETGLLGLVARIVGTCCYGVASISRLLKITGLFCKRDL